MPEDGEKNRRCGRAACADGRRLLPVFSLFMLRPGCENTKMRGHRIEKINRHDAGCIPGEAL